MLERNKIIQGDCLEVLKTLPDNSVNCCITSPPYYGLRDYGTGTWVGGDPECNHVIKHNRNKSVCGVGSHSRMERDGVPVGGTIIKHVCPLCGAVREDKQVGLEDTPEDYISKLVDIFHEVKRILTDDGTLWVNIGDSYNGYKGNAVSEYNDSEYVGGHGGHPTRDSGFGLECKNLKPKDLIGIPWMLAFALRKDGWYLRQDIIWHKPNPMPESVKDRCTKAHEYIFLLSKSPKYYFDYEAIQETATYQDATGIKFGGSKYGDNEDTKFAIYSGNEYSSSGVRNKRDVWSVTPSQYKDAHFATFPEDLIKPMVLAGCPKDGVVLDTFMGSGTTAIVAKRFSRDYVGIELNPTYIKMAESRIRSYDDGSDIIAKKKVTGTQVSLFELPT